MKEAIKEKQANDHIQRRLQIEQRESQLLNSWMNDDGSDYGLQVIKEKDHLQFINSFFTTTEIMSQFINVQEEGSDSKCEIIIVQSQFKLICKECERIQSKNDLEM
ncbi:unnamed protein product [Paramecium primaurelia]|uniref:Uncharacterized protein n=1 Tax=Paramecium primaurelia TaxID=5886 RepID=A0A8S1QQ54_PARPR|nr:unnamed protein product [Paramecium primaurelia]